MPGRLGPRFVIEATFLIVLAVGLALADQAPRTIVIVMAAAWVLVAGYEWLTWRDTTRYVDEGPYAWRADRLAPPWPDERPIDPYAQIVVPAPQAPVRASGSVEGVRGNREVPPAQPEEPEALTAVVTPRRRRRLGLRRAGGDELPPANGAAE